MMIYTSKLLAEASEKQEWAEIAATGFPDALQHAMAMADHFENIQAEEYILPTVVKLQPRFDSPEMQAVHNFGYTPL
ncbi:hypothetical protein MRS76_20265 [Rhizobiaceae bacterium n13]|uniref:hypothetical protein n=1 Tax=Ferirhizobium litorale TaxID=2927786 RepID=UPI0024B2D25D|nr:hypothetical protein [Fererhizobium litorale]MDI7864277.1 hypothetical protein [Fererhizobium litorale]